MLNLVIPNLPKRKTVPHAMPYKKPQLWLSLPVIKLARSTFFTLLILLFNTAVSFGQTKDTLPKLLTKIEPTNDTVPKLKAKTDTVKFHSPKKAAIMSTILPGLGQVYNKKYWKLPVLYIAMGGLIYSVATNNIKYVDYRDAYKYSVDKDPTTINIYAGKYRDDDLFNLQYKYNRRRNLSVIGIGLLYIMNIVDASVDAHLFTFDVSDDLSIRIQPTLINTATNINQYNTGLSLTIKL
jgi:hypothetical protein